MYIHTNQGASRHVTYYAHKSKWYSNTLFSAHLSTCSAVMSPACDGELDTAQLTHAHGTVREPGGRQVTQWYSLTLLPSVLWTHTHII